LENNSETCVVTIFLLFKTYFQHFEVFSNIFSPHLIQNFIQTLDSGI
jgi:hypothetical protein